MLAWFEDTLHLNRKIQYLEVLAKLGQNARECGSSRKSSPTGAKAPLILSHLLARLKPCPCYKARAIEYFWQTT
jgi:hypothetical protein